MRSQFRMLNQTEQDNILIGRLIELIFAHEFKAAMGSQAQNFTKTPLPAATEKFPKEQSLRNAKVGWNLYRRYIRSFPLMQMMGDEFIREFESLLEKFAFETGVNSMVAVKSDAIMMAKYYVSLAGAVREEVMRGKEPAGNDLLMWNRINVPRKVDIDTFSLYNPVQEAGRLDAARVAKAQRFYAAFRKAISVAKRADEYAHKQMRHPQEFVWWKAMKNAKDFSELPPVYIEMIEATMELIGYAIDNVMDDPVKRHAATEIFEKIPVSVMTMSIKMVNPAPFVDKTLKLFLWTPSKNVPSLVQFIAGIVCKSGLSKKEHKKMEKEIKPEFANIVQTIVSKGRISSNDSDAKFVSACKHYQYPNPSPQELKFFRLAVRVYEKEKFVEGLGNDDVKKFIVHAAKMAPPFLTEARKVCDVSKLMGQFFENVKKGLKLLKVYDDYQKQPDGTYARVLLPQDKEIQLIAELNALWKNMIPLVFPILHKIAEERGTAKESRMFVDMIDNGYIHLLRVPVKSKMVRPFLDTVGPNCEFEDLLEQLSKDEQDTLWDEVELINDLSKKGTHEALWPKMPMIEERLFPLFHRRMEQETR